MTEQERDVRDVQAVVTLASGIGLALLAIPLLIVVSRATDQSGGETARSLLWIAALGWPFALGFITRWWPWPAPQDSPRTRWFWLLCCLGIPLPLVVLHGLGILVAAVMLVYPWAFWTTRSATGLREG